MPPIPNPYLKRIAVPAPPVPMLPYDQQPLYRRIEKLKAALAIVVGLLALTIIGAALSPFGEPTHPLRVAEEAPAAGLASTR